MPLDQDCAALVALIAERRPPRNETLSPEQARAGMKAAREAAALPPPPISEIRDLKIPAIERDIAARLYVPSEAGASGSGLIYFHGGGWVLGDLESHDILCRRIANESNCRVIAVDYRLAPEHKFPAAFDDAVDAVRWIFAHARELGLDARQLMIGGDSSGANLAAGVTQELREGGLQLRMQILLYPTTDLDFAFPSHALAGDQFPVLKKTMLWFRDNYLGSVEQRADWRASPLKAESFTDLPPAYVVTAGYDPLRDEGIAYAHKMIEAGVPVTHRHYPGQIHAFLTIGTAFPTTEWAIRDIGRAIKDQIQRVPPA